MALVPSFGDLRYLADKLPFLQGKEVEVLCRRLAEWKLDKPEGQPCDLCL